MKKKHILFVLFFSLASCTQTPPSKKKPVYPVQVTKVITKDMPIYLETIGNVDPMVDVDITSRVTGEITGVYFTQGAQVKQGDLLFTIDPRALQAKVQKAQGSVQQYMAKLDIAREKVLRFSTLTEEDYYAKIHFEELTSNLHAIEGALLQAKGSLEAAKVQLSYCWIYSPIDGKAGILQVDQGNIVEESNQRTLVTIKQIKPIYVTFFFPEKYLPDIRNADKQFGGLQTIVSTDGFQKESIHGSLEMVNNSVDTETGTINMRSIFTNKKEVLWPGQYVRVRLVLQVEKDACVMPYTAVQYDSKGAFAFIITNEQTVLKRYLTLGRRFDKEIIIQKGVRPGERVVTLGAQNLFPGAKVSVQTRAAL